MERTIVVKGMGHVAQSPNAVELQMTLTSAHRDYEKTMDKAAEQVGDLKRGLSACGFEETDVKTSSFRVLTEYRSVKDKKGNYERVFDCYKCVHELKLTFDLDKKRLSKTLGILATCSAAPEFHIRFVVKDADELKQKVLASAARDAQRKAKTICEALGAKLGRILRVDYDWINVELRSRTVLEDACLGSSVYEGEVDLDPEDVESDEEASFTWEIE